ncbi:protein phosphatase 1, regulatory subunit 17-like isoform X1 [Mobula hypostoma]|uniref:protein phosphatase 1, regulatory subunit 17-like isoform X1 n=1 Tax=Mobula hypostoma TaxID=723540 RepID=UPI002FC3B39E
MRDCCQLVLTETWLKDTIPGSAIQLEGLNSLRANRNAATSDDFSNLSEQLVKTCEINEGIEKDTSEDESKDIELEQKKPRRKDTPVQYVPPLIPGVKLMREEKQPVLAEDDEKDAEK